MICGLRAAAPGPLTAGAGAALAVGLALAPELARPASPGSLAALGGVAVALYLAGLAMPWPGALPWALGLLAVQYLVSLEVRRAPLDAGSPAYAAALFLCAELGWLGLEARRGGRPWPGRALTVAGLALGGPAFGALLLLVAGIPLSGGAPVTALGVAATITIAACLTWLGRR